MEVIQGKYVNGAYVTELNVSVQEWVDILSNKDVTTLIRCPKEKTGDYISPETVDEVVCSVDAGCCRHQHRFGSGQEEG